jgi:Sap, sulfolipid-1-addressing protein
LLIQATGLALLAALSPTALLVAAVYLGSARPRLTAAVYLAGAVAISLVFGVVILVVLRSVGLNHPGQHEPRYGLRLGLGIVLLGAGAVVATRKPRPPEPAKPNQSLVSRMVANPTPLNAFLVGVIVFAPGVTFLAALQVIATARAARTRQGHPHRSSARRRTDHGRQRDLRAHRRQVTRLAHPEGRIRAGQAGRY